MFELRIETDGLVRLSGRLDASEADKAIEDLQALEGPMTLDCSALEYISSAGLGVLLKTQKRLVAANGKLRLSGVSRHLRDIFQYSGFDRIFEIEPAAE